jgi:hypothetical protein
MNSLQTIGWTPDKVRQRFAENYLNRRVFRAMDGPARWTYRLLNAQMYLRNRQMLRALLA